MRIASFCLLFSALLIVLASSSASTLEDLSKQVLLLQKQIETLSKRQKNAAPCRPDFVESLNYTFVGQGRDMAKNSTEIYPDASKMNGFINIHQQDGNLFSMMIHVEDSAQDAYEFVCTVTDLLPNEAHCSLTYEIPHRPEGPAWVRAIFDETGRQEEDGCIPKRVSIIGTYFFWNGKGDAGVYSLDGQLST